MVDEPHHALLLDRLPDLWMWLQFQRHLLPFWQRYVRYAEGETATARASVSL
jgi:hypothetical protein